MFRYLRHMALLAAMVLAFTAVAGTYSVDDLPNVQKQDHTKHLVNPDGIISPAVEARIDSLLIDARRRSSAEVVAVIVDDIGTDDIDDYATRLFNKWGIGKHDKNNGILIIVARDQRAATIRTGYAVEGPLPDILCGRIVREQMIPRFREGDYEGGMLDAVTEVHRVVTDEQVREELLSEEEDNYGGDDEPVALTALKVSGIMSVILMFVFGISMLDLRSKSDSDKYKETKSTMQILTIVSGLLLFLPIFALLALWLVRRYWRYKARKCSVCGNKMQRVKDPQAHAMALTAAQNLEERIHSEEYDVWRCPHCAHTDVEKYDTSSKYKTCPKCHAHTSKLIGQRVIERPTTHSEGLGEEDYQCLHCHNTYSNSYKIPMRQPRVIVGGGRGRGGGFGGGGGSFGGGFGGGRTGGGGATGRW